MHPRESRCRFPGLSVFQGNGGLRPRKAIALVRFPAVKDPEIGRLICQRGNFILRNMYLELFYFIIRTSVNTELLITCALRFIRKLYKIPVRSSTKYQILQSRRAIIKRRGILCRVKFPRMVPKVKLHKTFTTIIISKMKRNGRMWLFLTSGPFSKSYVTQLFDFLVILCEHVGAQVWQR